MNKQVIMAGAAVFAVYANENTGKPEAVAYFPNTKYRGNFRMGYVHGEGYGPCCDAFILLECRLPRTTAERNTIARLKKEMTDEGIIFSEMDGAKWYAEKTGRKAEIVGVVDEMTTITDSEALLNVNVTRALNKARAVA